MNSIHPDTAAKKTAITTDKPSVRSEGGTVRVIKQLPPRDAHDCSETPIYLDKIVLNSDLDWF